MGRSGAVSTTMLNKANQLVADHWLLLFAAGSLVILAVLLYQIALERREIKRLEQLSGQTPAPGEEEPPEHEA